MKVSIKDLAVQMPLGNKGVVFDVYDNQDNFVGDLRIGRAKIEWCKGRTREGNGTHVTWPDLVRWLESQG